MKETTREILRDEEQIDLKRRLDNVMRIINKKIDEKQDLSLEIAILCDEKDRYKEMLEKLS